MRQENRQPTSVFDGLKAPEYYGVLGIAIIVYILIIQMAILLFGMANIIEGLYTPSMEILRRPHTIALLLVGIFLAFAPVIGIIVKGKPGLILTASANYFMVGFFLLEIWPNFPQPIIIASLVFAVSLAMMHGYHFKRFYKVQEAGHLITQHVVALLIGIVLVVPMPYALGWN